MPYPLQLTANIGGWRLLTARRNQPKFKEIAQKIFARDNFMCQFCSFRDFMHPEVVNLDGNYRNNHIDNMVTSCLLCMQCGFLGVPNLGHKIIVLPQISQVELMNLSRVLFCAMNMSKEYSELAKTMYRQLRQLSEPVEAAFGKDTSQSDVFGQGMIDMLNSNKKMDKQAQQKGLVSLRLLPNPRHLGEAIANWATSITPKIARGR